MCDHQILPFLIALKENNSLEWMHQNKAWQREAASQFEALLQGIVSDLAKSEPALASLNAKDLVFRMNRDTRFGRDKSPYTPAFRAHISPAGRAPVPVGYYLCIAPGASFLGGGLFASMFQDATRRIRDAICADGAEFEAILKTPDFARRFTLSGERLKNVPRGYDAAHPQAEYLKFKSWYIEAPISDEALYDLHAFREQAVQDFLCMRPFNAFLNGALDGFQMPERPSR